MTPSLGPSALDLDEALTHLALQRLAWAYCHGVDRGDLALVRSCYHDDAVDDHGGMFRGGPDEFVAFLAKAQRGVATRHTIESMLFLVDGERAQGELVNTAYHRVGDREVVLAGRYLDTYARRDGVWRISHRSLVLDHAHERQVSTHDGFIGRGVPHARPDTTDPVYTLALFAQARGL
jgi:hypothetical protein